MAKKKTINNQVKTVLIAISDVIKGIFGILATIIRAIAYLIRDVFTALDKFAKVIAILLISITGSVLILITALYVFTATFGLKESPTFQEIRDQIAAELVEDLQEIESETEEEPNEAK